MPINITPETSAIMKEKEDIEINPYSRIKK